MDRLPAPASAASAAPVAERASAAIRSRARTRAPSTAERAGVRGDRADATPPQRLDSLQAWLVDAITGPDFPAASARSVVRDGPRMDADARIEIYRSGYRARLVECMRDDYSVLAEALGEDTFESLCHAYIAAHPSTSPNLNGFGRHMASFARTARHVLDDRAGFCADLAALESALVEVIHAPLPARIDVAPLSALAPDAWGGLRFTKSASARLVKTEYPVNAYYQARRGRGEAPEVPAAQAESTAVYRRGAVLWRMALTPAMTRVLEALFAGVRLEEALACMGADESDPAVFAEAERSVMIWFREWVQAGFFESLSLNHMRGAP